jgi:hypothetical protein
MEVRFVFRADARLCSRLGDRIGFIRLGISGLAPSPISDCLSVVALAMVVCLCVYLRHLMYLAAQFRGGMVVNRGTFSWPSQQLLTADSLPC